MGKSKHQVKWTTADILKRFPWELSMTPGDAPSQSPFVRVIPVEDAGTLEGFLSNAKQVWIQIHLSAHRRGRPSERAKVFRVLRKAYSDGHIGKKITQGKLTRLVQDRLGDNGPSEDAIRKYVKMWMILQRNGKVVPDLTLPPSDLRWFEKHASSAIRAFREYEEAVKDLRPKARHQGGTGPTYITPLRGKIGKQTGLENLLDPPGLTPEAHDKLKRLEIELLDFLLPHSDQ